MGILEVGISAQPTTAFACLAAELLRELGHHNKQAMLVVAANKVSLVVFIFYIKKGIRTKYTLY